MSVKEDKKNRKLRGGYYTPPEITDFISEWAIHKDCRNILEPSCGDGEFLRSITKKVNSARTLNAEDIKITAVELDEIEAGKVKPISKNINLHVGDFFKYSYDNLSLHMFDCIIGNPPFIRYQDFPEEQRLYAFQLMKEAGLKPSRLTNAWIPFLVISSQLLKDNGRLGMVIPAELFQVNYAAETRRFLAKQFSRIHILTFNELVFDNIQQEVVILLAEKSTKTKHYINIYELENIESLKNFTLPKYNQKKELDHKSEKWIQYYLSNYELGLLRHVKLNTNIPLAKNFYEVDVGIVTGQNKFFVLSKKQVQELNLAKFTTRIVGKANHLSGLAIDEAEWESLVKKNHPNYLLNLKDSEFEKLPDEIQNYIFSGEENQYHLGYKCRIRKKWWIVPSVWIPDGFMLRQVHRFPKLVLNDCGATNTDTLHRIKFLNGENKKKVIGSFTNSLTFAFSEVLGRSYGGGVLTFEPTEAENIPIPYNKSINVDFHEIDKLIRDNEIEVALSINNQMILKNYWGFSQKEIDTFDHIWQKLSQRRINRNRKRRSSLSQL